MEQKSSSWWKTLPGILTGITSVLAASTALVVALQETGLFKKGDEVVPDKSEIPEGNKETIAGIKLPAFVIIDEAYKKKKDAQRRLVELNHLGYSNTGFFWIPDFEYLSGTELFQVYVGPYTNKSDAQNDICHYNSKFGKITYGVKLSMTPGREVVRCDK